MQREESREDSATTDSETKSCQIATKFWYPVAKLRLEFFVNFEPCYRQCVIYTPEDTLLTPLRVNNAQ